ncbi:MAG: sulfate ABC transporter substrate-binding protein [Methylacidiphilales bacterium]|nr:sulfate ABC transporter substrate-binding protein [Candidatus Methylacidiphilales bacterium]MDW8349478.1 sulfate ABC transporter substrate-binding protein [Verrucomicrobiae bacterium]
MKILLLCIPLLALSACQDSAALLNVSYDPTREFFTEYNLYFSDLWEKQHGKRILISQSHGGSGKQARAVIDGIPADVVTLALGYDIDAIAAKGLIRKNWQQQLPYNSAPYTSTIIFVVRKGNPKKIRGWDDLIRKDVEVVIANPLTSGGARWAYLAAWGHAQITRQGDIDAIRQYMKALYANAPILDTSARGAAMSFAERYIGDVLVSWENEALLLLRYHSDELEIVTPPYSILAEPAVAVVDRNVDERGTRSLAEAYLKTLYTEEAQDIAARHYYRPRSQSILKRYAHHFPSLRLFTLDEMFGSWADVHKKHFASDGEFDRIIRELGMQQAKK